MQNDFLLSSKLVCPSGWKEYDGNCFGFVPAFMSLENAKKFCMDREVSSELPIEVNI